MLGVLLESRATRQRRAGGAMMSVAAHLAIVALVAATAARVTTSAVEHPAPVVLRFQPAPPTPARIVAAPAAPASPRIIAPTFALLRLAAPTRIPSTIPPVIQVAAQPYDSVMIGAPRGATRGIPTGIIGDATSAPADNDWRGSEVLMHLIATVKPRYPDYLRGAGVDGRVLVRFTVDTSGRVDMSSVKVLESTHDLFTRSVMDALRGFRFKPAEVAGRRVSALAEMPFEFQLSR